MNTSTRAKNLVRIALVLLLSIGISVNSMFVGSWIVGLPLSICLFILASTAVGEVFFLQEKGYVRIALGFAALFSLIALLGGVLIILGQFSRLFSLILITAMSLVFSTLPLRIKSAVEEGSPSLETSEKHGGRMRLYLASSGFLACVAIAFYALTLARTGEGIISVWFTIPVYFLPVFFLCSLTLMFIVFFTRSSVGLKLSLITIFSFLAEGLFWIVWYPGRYGDPFQHLGAARFIDRTGMPFAFQWMLDNRLLIDLIKSKAHYAPLVLWTRMFSVDIYWVHTLLVPFLWAFLVPLFSYKLAETLAKGRLKQFPLLTAFASSLFPSLVLWGAVSVSNSVGFVLFLFAVFLAFYWIRTGKRQVLILSLLVSAATFFAHDLPWIFTVNFILLAVMVSSKIQRTGTRAGKVVFFLLLLLVYPLGLYLVGTRLAFSMLFSLENYGSFQSSVVTVMTLFALLGVVLALKGRYVVRKYVFLASAFYAMAVFEYYLTNYGMSGLPYGANRVLVIADLLLLPFVALGVIEGVNILTKVFSLVRSNATSLTKVNSRLSSRTAGLALVCLVLSAQAALALNQAYPRQEIVSTQPAVYMMDAIYYINSTSPGPYVVLCETQLANVAIGLLGIDYGWAGGMRGMFGMPDYTYPTIIMHGRMVRSPSPSIMQEAIDFTGWAKVAYFVLEATEENFNRALEETSAILPVEATFGNGKLYVFKYLSQEAPVVEGSGPSVKVTFEDGNSSEVTTSFKYTIQSNVEYKASLSGHLSYNITGYPKHWVFSYLTIDNVMDEFDESSDVNEFIYLSNVGAARSLSIYWGANDIYPNATWKEDSFKSIGVNWNKHPSYGTIFPNIASDGRALNISWNFVQGIYPNDYQVFYYIRSANVSTNDYHRVIVRWRASGPVAAVAVYYGSGEAAEIVAFGTQSLQWKTTVVQVPPNRNITSVLVGLTNLGHTEITGFYYLQVDYILICV